MGRNEIGEAPSHPAASYGLVIAVPFVWSLWCRRVESVQELGWGPLAAM
jgi:hypothetical protein